MTALMDDNGGLFFLYGYGDTGKAFIFRTSCAALRSMGDIALAVASSGIVSLLLLGGTIAHSRFCIPLNVDEDTYCNIKPGSHFIELLVATGYTYA
ncbi:hypothetical protein L6164_008573 [Bauhinia variegata]|uniref:Uncharacterized protein n=1 Tax=Bauhinia variegata TaxID=167791 RepID=A0ACB9PJZ1_BAUVA|nr:hypothetical protein L6164_008573 [Bauhinia variegata]